MRAITKVFTNDTYIILQECLQSTVYLLDFDTGSTLKQNSECKFFCSQYPEIATHPEKNVKCQINVKIVATPEKKRICIILW